ncbi:hypothetical protein HMPREF2880_06220 [Neisseria sp. HMSC067G11]|jgi:hypothetical protein|uniref:hypothetical protein n=1 Tax=Neisseria TaxID=482 RepID=UPI00066AF13F|nr:MULTISPECIES: hypothetical protein [Neisseria]OFK03034.1 hypothetical protein HMPREF2834_00540 [Neisseria sp. HMSC067H04]OFL25098.1 hypothetical protein HMPREF2778_01705 [Neisseria sp. HMSC075C12]OFR57105.1 hypothetical protein HMPREF2880_06220 [Neisseria sp. HMSC067G11]OFR74980.1 hypothetical protein HMPREF2871_06320 [Neisseria sp. HMSC067G12]OFR84041.1 hypothetical protein HMPREF2865_06330 [Neisseria sp. HMSC073G10]
MTEQNQIGHQQAPIVSVKEWLITNLILMIPLVNIVMMLVWAFSSNTNPNKANYFKASLILFAIVMAIYLVLAVVFFGSVAANQYQ